MGGCGGPGGNWRSRESEAKRGRSPRWMGKGKVMEGFGELCLCVVAASVSLLPGVRWWTPGFHWWIESAQTDSRDAEWRRVRMCWHLPASLHLLSPLLIMMTFIQGVVAALSLLLPNLVWVPPWASFNSEPCREEPSRKWSSSLSKLTHYKLPWYLTERTETFYRKIISLLCLITP